MTDTEAEIGRDLVTLALAEDLGGTPGVDLTAVALAGAHARATLIARQDGVVCGLGPAVWTFASRGVTELEIVCAEGSTVRAGDPLIHVTGGAAAVLSAERTALNLIQRLSGTATLTRAFVDAVAGTGARILDTRKTTPGMRALQRWAVRCGGGDNHRFGLFDEAMLKDNHIAASGSIAAAVRVIRDAHPGVRIHVEADTLAQAGEAADAGADVVLLDNMTDDELRAAIERIAGRALTEASGGVDLTTVAAIAATGVDRISIGALTHSAPAFDAALDLETTT